MSKENLQMPIINPKAAGIDVGSRSHFVSIGQGKDQVKEFGVYTDAVSYTHLTLPTILRV